MIKMILGMVLESGVLPIASNAKNQTSQITLSAKTTSELTALG